MLLFQRWQLSPPVCAISHPQLVPLLLLAEHYLAVSERVPPLHLPWSRAVLPGWERTGRRGGQQRAQTHVVAGPQPYQAIFIESDKWKLAPIDFISITSEKQFLPKTSFKHLSGRKYRVLSQRKCVPEYISKTTSEKCRIKISISTVYAIPCLCEDTQLNLQAFCLQGKLPSTLTGSEPLISDSLYITQYPKCQLPPPNRQSGSTLHNKLLLFTSR